MRAFAAVLERFSEPLVLREADVGEGLPVKVKASGMCGRDLVIWRGGFRNLTPPLILGHEIYGEYEGNPVGVYGVETCGECRYCRAGKENLCENARFLGEARPGGYAEVVTVKEGGIFPLPDREYEKYAAGVCPLATAIHSSKVAGVKKGDTVLVTGAGGGVGIHTIQYLKSLGARVVSVTSPSKSEIVSRFSDQVITQKDFSKQVKDVDVVIELVGSETINESLRALRREGTLVLVGNVTGKEISLARPALTIMREHRIVGSASYTRAEVEEAVKLIHEGEVKPVYRKYHLREVNTAMKDLMEGKVLGRAVLVTG
ncbi:MULTISPECIES: zinc-binding dehydrogenase [Metallosphaera]|uniref:Alcohol dehydrogenase GroES domain protein n=3 Tax=Metallosphaera TaxID=41980 RepID=A4YDS3_METS5|nr:MULTISPECIES: alcohol dehydrogenase catalytic domain-containing protein [Metallosphaera]ABP94575.1 Alcohol dehydrogenase GroES domain protein [Metallosphaera sedula DSM 5348]AIM26562.1 Alcohol dehydrogenase GroES domain protein [Metallosphaera sedula]AKV73548.1 alcohol dehydrogenase [Metallosphaera sedula]AKV75790.1 alcohol dehydrogenase [Metallosphaera sedula]AKV78037.1 alcohol dehydrogenase [Metallosphaera sedula]